MSTGIDDLIMAIKGSVGLPEGEDEESLSLDVQYLCGVGADAIKKLQSVQQPHPDRPACEHEFGLLVTPIGPKACIHCGELEGAGG